MSCERVREGHIKGEGQICKESGRHMEKDISRNMQGGRQTYHETCMETDICFEGHSGRVADRPTCKARDRHVKKGYEF